MNHELTPQNALPFIFAGHGTATLVGNESRYTYKFSTAENPNSPVFVRVLVAPEQYEYIGFIAPERGDMVAGRKGNANHPAFKALAWYAHQARHRPEVAEKATFMYSGKCGKCGRELTVPESIVRGLGPQCAAV